LKINIKSNEKGFTIVEMMIAAAIMVVVVLGGIAAYNHFRSQTVVEISKMDDISQFNLLTKDLITFSEGAGISTFYLNMPIKTTSCTDDLPCVRQLDNKTFVNPTGSMPPELSGKDCIQFYKDAEGKLESKMAYPGKPALKDKIWDNPEIDLASMTRELYATWVLKDPASPPFLMMKTRDSSVYLSLLRTKLQKSRQENQASNNVLYAAFESDSDVDVIKNLKGYPFLIYNSTFISHYTIQFAEDIIDCKNNLEVCKDYTKKIGAVVGLDLNTLNNTNATNFGPFIGASSTDKVYFIKFSPIDFSQPFFQNIYTGNDLPSDCQTSWGEGLQPSSQYLFPTKALSVSEVSEEISDLKPAPINVLHLNHHYGDKPSGQIEKGIMVALPIDIITFKIEQASENDPKNLVTELWHHTEIKKKTKIYNLKSPFILTRKLGSQELGIWYNPLQRN
jgi:prepilin-type N-terminal cleavage/methylation domain-containing protein